MGRPWLSLPTLQNRQNHAFFHILAPNLLKNTPFSRFWLQNALKPRVFPRFGVKFAQKHAFFHVLASEFLKNTRVSTYLASKRCVFPRFGFRIAQKRVFFNVFAFKVAQSHVFSQVLASTLFKNVHLLNFLFTNCYSHTFFDVFGLKRFKKPCFFAVCFVSKSLMQGVFFLQTGAFAHRCFAHESFYTQTLYTRKLLHRKSTHRLFCTTNCFTRISFCTPKHLNTSAFYRGF